MCSLSSPTRIQTVEHNAANIQGILEWKGRDHKSQRHGHALPPDHSLQKLLWLLFSALTPLLGSAKSVCHFMTHFHSFQCSPQYSCIIIDYVKHIGYYSEISSVISFSEHSLQLQPIWEPVSSLYTVSLANFLHGVLWCFPLGNGLSEKDLGQVSQTFLLLVCMEGNRVITWQEEDLWKEQRDRDSGSAKQAVTRVWGLSTSGLIRGHIGMSRQRLGGGFIGVIWMLLCTATEG